MAICVCAVNCFLLPVHLSVTVIACHDQAVDEQLGACAGACTAGAAEC